MKPIFLLILSLPIFASAQSLVKCADSTLYFVTQNEKFHAVVKIPGTVETTSDSRVIVVNGYALQAVLLPKSDYATDGSGDLQVLSTYIISETQYFSEVYKERLPLKMEPADVLTDKKAVIWYFDIPTAIQSQIDSASPAIRRVFGSVVIGDYVYSISTTQMLGQPYEELKAILSQILVSINSGPGQYDQAKICAKVK